MTARDWIEIGSIAVALILSVLSFFPDLRKKLADARTSAAQERTTDANTYETMADTVGNLSRQLKDALTDIDAQRQMLDIERQERLKMQDTLNRTQSQLAHAQVALTAVSEELSAARTAVQELEAALHDEREARIAIEQEMTRTTERVRILERENVELRQERAELIATLSAYQDEMQGGDEERNDS